MTKIADTPALLDTAPEETEAATRKRARRAPAAPTKRAAKPLAATSTRRSAAAVNRQQRKVEDKRTAILSAALGLFSRFGMHGTSVDQVAARADVSKSNLLYYFASKEELYVCLLRDLLAMWLQPLRDFKVEQEPREAFGEYIRRKLAFSRDYPDASRLFCLEMIQGAPLLQDELRRELRNLVDRKTEVIQAWTAAGKLAPVEPHHLIFSLWAITQHYADFSVQVQAVTGHTLQEPAFFEQAVENVQKLVLDGLMP